METFDIDSDAATLFLAGDVMCGRGIDQILPHPCDPELHESHVQDARRYVDLAERRSGAIPRDVEPTYVWGEALEMLDEVEPDARIVNLETAVTRSDDFWASKGIHYRTSPENAVVLEAGGLDVCSVANNHVLDWGYDGLGETLDVLDALEIGHPGAGASLEAARAPATVQLPGEHVLQVFGLCVGDSGVPLSWRARESQPGVWRLDDLSEASIADVSARIASRSTGADLVVASIHWGTNWGWSVPDAHVRLGRDLVDEAGVDVVHGHSSHHVKGVEIHRGRPILYGCGDLITDYEGIAGHESFRGELSLLYLPTLDVASGRLRRFDLWPMRIERFQLRRADADETAWLLETLRRTTADPELEVGRPDERRLQIRHPSSLS